MNILIKLTSIVALVIAPHISQNAVVEQESKLFLFDQDSEMVEAAEATPVSGQFMFSEETAAFLWTARKVTGQHNGHFSGKGTIVIENNLVQKGEALIYMTSIVVDDVKDRESNQKLLNHLKSADFFNVERYPTANMIIHGSEKRRDNTYFFKGLLTLKGIEKPVEGTYNIITDQEKHYALNGSLTFDRSEFDVRYGSGKFFEDLGDDLIYDEVLIGFKIFLQ